MMARRSFLAASAAGSVLAASSGTFGQAGGQTVTPAAAKTGYAPVNGLKLYYEIHDTGEPLVLLRGGLGSTEMVGDALRLLARRGA